MTPPATPDEVARAVRESGPGGVSCWRNPACAHQHLDLRACRHLRFHQPGDLTVGADAGMTVADLDRILAPHGQFVPLEVAEPERTTLGTALACHLSGPLRHRYGTVRDFTIGLEMASPQGKLVRCGGRVVKNVAGYDWAKPVIGARGALGIITGANFKVFPRPGAAFEARFDDLSWAQVEALRSALSRSPLRPLAVELRSGGGQRAVAVWYTGTGAVQARYRDELARLGKVVFAGPGWPAVAGASNWSMPPAQAVAGLAALGDDVRVCGRLGLGVFHLAPAPPPPPIPPDTARLMARLKAALDAGNVCHGEDCAPR